MKNAVTLLLLSACFAVSRGDPSIKISGPDFPVLEGEDVVLECYGEDVSDLEGLAFQKYMRWMNTWMDLDAGRYLRCWYYNLNVTRSEDRLLLQINYVSDWQSGPYRCVKYGNQSDETLVSENITIPVYYLRDVYLQRSKAWNPTVPDVLLVEEGSDVDIKCSASSSQEPVYEWGFSDYMIPSDTLSLTNVGLEDSGRYTCVARHPEMFDLMSTKSFQLQVVTKRQEYSALRDYGFNDILLYVTVPAVALIIFVLTVIILTMRHRRQQRKPKISLVDVEKRAPIYKGSSQSICTNSSDTQPLVM
ncbi:uncharacterized protein LOC128470585 [Spea bombifrons]|uniref:uncharacterized protein LOC128470585 n=1 Tax=Spea bombifrons TaxID=233779 RepID=UPI002349A83D|nr:uncharacterized protein LOC128470585 [Spea bombifrons]